MPVSFTTTDRNGRRQMLAVKLTDSSGSTGSVTVQTPPSVESRSPGTAVPYTCVDIRADVPGYSSVVAQGIQVFSGVHTIQNLRLLPSIDARPPIRIDEPPQRL